MPCALSRAHERRPILVTGSHRSGTTWVAAALNQLEDFELINEPFNLRDNTRTSLCPRPFSQWFTYVTEENAEEYLGPLQRTFAFQYDLFYWLTRVRGYRSLMRGLRDFAFYRECRKKGKTPIVKDPIAVFSVEWLARVFDMRIVVLVRHPAAFASSLKRLRWTFTFSQLLNQELLMRDHLEPYREQLVRLTKHEADVVDHAILLWNVIYSVVLGYKRSHSEWGFFRHEDLSERPDEAFASLCKFLEVAFSPDIAGFVRSTTDSGNPVEAPVGVVHQLERDSRANRWAWKSRLSNQEIDRIRIGTAAVAGHFYREEEW